MVKDLREKMKATVGGRLKAPDTLFASTPRRVEPQTAEFKRDIFTERLNLPLSPAQKDLLDNLAKDFQRKRVIKTESINRNTVIRALISALEDVSFSSSDVANTEQELCELMKRKLGGLR